MLIELTFLNIQSQSSDFSNINNSIYLKKIGIFHNIKLILTKIIYILDRYWCSMEFIFLYSTRYLNHGKKKYITDTENPNETTILN